ncbi:MAG: hypothetical protein F4Z16_06500 [Rhodothermaceae bacterium]|nr:hypothetical protein [Rhodothermaceae bacterium]MYD66865.1 hypothetical protein [Rhodothermaceae bacterium]MYI78140.1 hypothetical protein [Gammaproteobacteria bacterium]
MNGTRKWDVYRFDDVTENWREALGSPGLALVSGRVRKASKAGTYEGYDAKNAVKKYVFEIITPKIKQQLAEDGMKVDIATIPHERRWQANHKLVIVLPPNTSYYSGPEVEYFRVFIQDVDD